MKTFKKFINDPQDEMNKLFVSNHLFTFSDLVSYEINLHEGLISSYNVTLLIKHLQKFFGKRLILHPTHMPKLLSIFKNEKYGYIFGIDISINDYKDIDSKKIEQIIQPFGYFISAKSDSGNFKIEPKNPVNINELLKQNNIQTLYHITHNSNIEKIKKIGLTPRESETTFSHPHDRIYLLFSNDMYYITAFKRTLARYQSDGAKNEKDFVVLSTPFNNVYNYYIDEFSTIIKDGTTFIGCFVLKNIPPNQITITDL